jgi:putative ABC transport system permease protein|tara:strand:+ start:1252 stop:3687 length:2436 start_codon:yes stop_codon:yes gene_type:complete
VSTLLTKRLARSLWRTKLRLYSVILMIVVGVFAGISFGTYANSTQTLYDNIYADDENGVNLPDIWVENSAATWDGATATSLCQTISEQWPDVSMPLEACEPRMVVDGLMFHIDDGEEKLIPAVWHGIDEGRVDRVWIPEDDCCSGRLASADDEIVLDEHAASGMEISIGDTVSIGAGHGSMNFTVVGIGYHSHHLYFSQTGSILPADPGTFATGYLSDTGIERLANLSAGSANLLLLDVVGSPEYDLQSTEEDEGERLSEIISSVKDTMIANDDASFIAYDRSGVDSVEFLRADAEGASKSYPIVTGMIAMVAGITIFLSLQRLIQSQAREIAILRTLGIPKSAIMPGFILAPIAIGLIGSSIGIILGAAFGGPAMISMYEDIIGIPAIGFHTDAPLIMQNFVIAMGVVIIAGIKPALDASRMQPLEILRGQHEVRLSSRGIQRLTSRLPTTVGLTIRSSMRKPMRLIFTFFAVGLSMLIFGTMSLMMDSMGEVFGVDGQNWDAQVNVPFGGEDAVIGWAEENGAGHESMLVFPGNAEGDTRQFLAYGLDVISTGDDAMLPLNLLEGALPVAGVTTTQVLVDEGTMMFLEWEVGQTQTVMFGPFSLDVEITGVTRGETTRTVYFHRSDLSDAIGLEATTVLLSLPEGVELDEQIGEMSIGITQKQDMLDSFDSLFEKQQGIYNAILGLGVIIAIAVLFNTLLMNLSERDSELATLRVLGAPISRIRSMMLGEHLAIGLIGGVLAAVFTIVMAQYMISSIVQWAFFFTLQPDIMAALELILVVVVISVMCTPYGTWRVSRMDLVEKVKDLSQ